MKTFRADLYVHSSHSNKPGYWALRKFNCPESYSSPEFIYHAARRQGMDYVTITDHNTVNGALEIAHLPGAFVSVEVTAYFPEDGCKVHMVVLNITEETFREINRLRKNIYELVAYLDRDAIPHFIAHPLYAQNEKLSADHFEKMLLLFRVFETKNGSRAIRYGEFLEKLLEGLTPAKMALLTDKHGMEPHGETPWVKGRVGGSDDHGGLFIAGAHTAVPEGTTLDRFLDGVAQRRSLPAGEKTRPLPRWVDVRRFYPERRDPSFWENYAAIEGMKFLYVGRVSREKNLELLADAFMEVATCTAPAQLVIVGDGPYLDKLREKLRGYPVIYTGFLEGERLATAYASSDVFVFPSTTDTFGNVVLEAQASGLPVVVSDCKDRKS